MNKIKKIIKESIRKVLDEGIDFDQTTKTVSFNPSHENNIDTSIENNPTLDDKMVKGINVWSIFKRKKGLYGDGNPLVYALKGEEGWAFKSKEDEAAIERQFDAIAAKFASIYPIEVTIIIPSRNSLNEHIAKVIMSKSDKANLIEGIIRKMTTEEVNDIVLAFGSKFRQFYGKNFNDAYYQLTDYLQKMDDERDGTFTRHFIKDAKMRNVLDSTLRLSDDRYARFANKINGQNILIVDDTISRGQTINEACKIMMQTYAPKSITVLTLFSKLT